MPAQSVAFESGSSTCRGDLWLPADAPSEAPVVVMAHGFGAERSFRLPAYAERFADRGVAALTFDYRGFGDSDGDDQLVDPGRHRADWLAAVAFTHDHDALDAERLALWGTSFSGGHVIETAARVDVAAVLAQVPFVDGLATLGHLARHAGLRYPFVATRHGVADAVRTLLRRSPHTVPITGPPGEFALLNTPGAEAGYRSIVPDDSDWENACPARIALKVPLYRPIRRADDVDAPVFLTIAEADRVVPPSASERLARRLDHVETLRLDVGHFDVYRGEPFERAVGQQAAFLSRHLE